MDDSIIIRQMEPGEEEQVAELIQEIFDQYIAADYTEQGIAEFGRFSSPQQIAKRRVSNLFLLAIEHGQPIGVIEMRDSHICLLFVDRTYQGRGIATRLINTAFSLIEENGGQVRVVTVNSSPYAVRIYQKLGFVATGDEQEVDGIRFIPMKLMR